MAEVFADHPGANYAFEVTQELALRPTCVQYRESDLAFVRRLLAEEGLSFRFEHEQQERAPQSGSGSGSGSGSPDIHPFAPSPRHLRQPGQTP